MTVADTSTQQLFVGGEWVDPAGSQLYDVINPATGLAVCSVPCPSTVDADRATVAAREAFDAGPWPRMSIAERAAVVTAFCDQIELRLAELDTAWSTESGATITHAEGLHRLSLAIMRRLVDDAADLTLRQRRQMPDAVIELVREPIGPTLIISTWNGPLLYIAWKVVPALLAGCTVVLKAAEESALTSALIANAAATAGFPRATVSILGASADVSAHLVSSPLIDKVSLTGSIAAGKSVMAACASRLASVTLELGGKSPALIADDIEMDRVLPSLIPGFSAFQGQICAALTRVIVPVHRHDEVVSAIADAVGALRIGDPRRRDVDQGPLGSRRQLDRVKGYVASGLRDGARLVTGGRPPELDGFYYQPTVFADVRPGMLIEQEEIFGPVLSVIDADDIDDAVRIANGTRYGLAASVYASDENLARSVAARVQAGTVAINDAGISFYAPFGGVKQSGFGREGGVEGLAEFLQYKSVKLPC